jgi:hypothetical protein
MSLIVSLILFLLSYSVVLEPYCDTYKTYSLFLFIVLINMIQKQDD